MFRPTRQKKERFDKFTKEGNDSIQEAEPKADVSDTESICWGELEVIDESTDFRDVGDASEKAASPTFEGRKPRRRRRNRRGRNRSPSFGHLAERQPVTENQVESRDNRITSISRSREILSRSRRILSNRNRVKHASERSKDREKARTSSDAKNSSISVVRSVLKSREVIRQDVPGRKEEMRKPALHSRGSLLRKEKSLCDRRKLGDKVTVSHKEEIRLVPKRKEKIVLPVEREDEAVLLKRREKFQVPLIREEDKQNISNVRIACHVKRGSPSSPQQKPEERCLSSTQVVGSERRDTNMNRLHKEEQAKSNWIQWNEFTRIVIVEDGRLQLDEAAIKDKVHRNIKVLQKPLITLENLPVFVDQNVEKSSESTLLICCVGSGNLVRLQDFGACGKMNDHEACQNIYIQNKDFKVLAQQLCNKTRFVKKVLQSLLGSKTETIFTSILPIDFLMYQFHHMRLHREVTGHQLELEYKQRDILPWKKCFSEALDIYNGYLGGLEPPHNLMMLEELLCPDSENVTRPSVTKKMLDGYMLTGAVSSALSETFADVINRICHSPSMLKETMCPSPISPVDNSFKDNETCLSSRSQVGGRNNLASNRHEVEAEESKKDDVSADTCRLLTGDQSDVKNIRTGQIYSRSSQKPCQNQDDKYSIKSSQQEAKTDELKSISSRSIVSSRSKISAPVSDSSKSLGSSRSEISAPKSDRSNSLSSRSKISAPESDLSSSLVSSRSKISAPMSESSKSCVSSKSEIRAPKLDSSNSLLSSRPENSASESDLSKSLVLSRSKIFAPTDSSKSHQSSRTEISAPKSDSSKSHQSSRTEISAPKSDSSKSHQSSRTEISAPKSDSSKSQQSSRTKISVPKSDSSRSKISAPTESSSKSLQSSRTEISASSRSETSFMKSASLKVLSRILASTEAKRSSGSKVSPPSDSLSSRLQSKSQVSASRVGSTRSRSPVSPRSQNSSLKDLSFHKQERYCHDPADGKMLQSTLPSSKKREILNRLLSASAKRKKEDCADLDKSKEFESLKKAFDREYDQFFKHPRSHPSYEERYHLFLKNTTTTRRNWSNSQRIKDFERLWPTILKKVKREEWSLKERAFLLMQEENRVSSLPSNSCQDEVSEYMPPSKKVKLEDENQVARECAINVMVDRSDRSSSEKHIRNPLVKDQSSSSLAGKNLAEEGVLEILIALDHLAGFLGPLRDYVKVLYEKAMRHRSLGFDLKTLFLGEEKELFDLIVKKLKSIDDRNLNSLHKLIIEKSITSLSQFVKPFHRDIDIIAVAQQCVGRQATEIMDIIRCNVKHQGNSEASDDAVLQLYEAVKEELLNMHKKRESWSVTSRACDSLSSSGTSRSLSFSNVEPPPKLSVSPKENRLNNWEELVSHRDSNQSLLQEIGEEFTNPVDNNPTVVMKTKLMNSHLDIDSRVMVVNSQSSPMSSRDSKSLFTSKDSYIKSAFSDGETSGKVGHSGDTVYTRDDVRKVNELYTVSRFGDANLCNTGRPVQSMASREPDDNLSLGSGARNVLRSRYSPEVERSGSARDLKEESKNWQPTGDYGLRKDSRGAEVSVLASRSSPHMRTDLRDSGFSSDFASVLSSVGQDLSFGIANASHRIDYSGSTSKDVLKTHDRRSPFSSRGSLYGSASDSFENNEPRNSNGSRVGFSSGATFSQDNSGASSRVSRDSYAERKHESSMPTRQAGGRAMDEGSDAYYDSSEHDRAKISGDSCRFHPVPPCSEGRHTFRSEIYKALESTKDGVSGRSHQARNSFTPKVFEYSHRAAGITFSRAPVHDSSVGDEFPTTRSFDYSYEQESSREHPFNPDPQNGNPSALSSRKYDKSHYSGDSRNLESAEIQDKFCINQEGEHSQAKWYAGYSAPPSKSSL